VDVSAPSEERRASTGGVGTDEPGPGAAADPGGVEPESPSSKRRAVGLSTVAGAVLGGLAVVFVVHSLLSDWSEVSDRLAEASWGWMVGGFVLAAAAMVSMAWSWRFVFRLLGVEVPPGRVTAWYFVGELGKYLPGGVWPVLGRGEVSRRGGVPRTRAYASVALSLAVLYLAAMFVAVALLPFAVSGGGFSPWMLFLLALPVGLVLLHHDVLEWLLERLRKATKRDITLEVPRWGETVQVVVRYLPSWVCVGLSTWMVARALTPHPSIPRVMFASVLSWIAGFLAVPVPAGFGIREAVMVAASGLGGLGAATAVANRVLFIVVDLVGGLLGAAVIGRHRRGGAVVGPLPEGVTAVGPDDEDVTAS
jgi:glycosyltransferase 2 family protein